jgi:hypothetical protein
VDKIASTGRKDRSELFLLTAERMRLHPVNVEKDFWVCWLLKQLFTIPEYDGWLVFKGGTSLSKCFKLIQRFSEDIDLAVNYEKLGFTGAKDPRQATLSYSKRQPLLEKMLKACQEYVAGPFLTALRARCRQVLGETGWTLTVSADPNSVEFRYPPSLAVSLSYIRPHVTLELGTHAEPIPHEPTPITSFAAEQFPQLFAEPGCSVTTVVARRTFWEKATILHAEYHRPLEKALLPRYSRHYADVAAMAGAPVRSEALADLLESVVTHKDRFYHSGWAKYLDAKPGTFRMVPRSERVAALRQDYQAMQPVFFGAPKTFEAILTELSGLENAINAIQG